MTLLIYKVSFFQFYLIDLKQPFPPGSVNTSSSAPSRIDRDIISTFKHVFFIDIVLFLLLKTRNYFERIIKQLLDSAIV